MLSSQREFLPYSAEYIHDVIQQKKAQGLDRSSKVIVNHSTDDLPAADTATITGAELPSEPARPLKTKRKKLPTEDGLVQGKSKPAKATVKAVTDLDHEAVLHSIQVKDPAGSLTHIVGVERVNVSNELVIYLSGFCSFAVIEGDAALEGFTLPNLKLIQVKRPIWTPAAHLLINMNQSATVKTSQDYDTLVLSREAKQALTELKRCKSCQCVLFIQESPMDQQGIMSIIEDQSFYYTHDSESLTSNSMESSELIAVRSAIIGTREALLSRSKGAGQVSSIEILRCPASWRHSARQLNSLYQKGNKVKLMICGANGVGKSSCMRFLINSLLSSVQVDNSPDKGVCVIDCDLGQPEFNHPGMLSLHVITSPVVSSSHLNLRPPRRSVFLGDVTSRHEPEQFCRALKLLFEEYLQIVQEDRALQRDDAPPQAPFTTIDIEEQKSSKSVSTKLPNSSSKNRFNILEDYDSESSKQAESRVLPAETEALEVMSTSKRRRKEKAPTKRVTPLLINTDGFVRYMGAEILSAVADITQPNLVYHLKNSSGSGSGNVGALSSSPGENHDHHHQPSIPVLDVIARTINQCKIFSLEAGSSGSSRFQKADLRNLRFLSYFLSGSSSSISSTARESVMKTVSVRNASLIGGDNGFFALSLLSIPPHVVPLNNCVFNIIEENSVPPASILAAINGKYVGIAAMDMMPGIDQVKMTPLRSRTSGVAFNLYCFESFTIVPHTSIGIVRAVDLVQQQIFLTVPRDINLTGKYLVITPVVNMQVASYLLSGTGFPAFPYQSGENTGEGAAQIKPRHNLKKRSFAS